MGLKRESWETDMPESGSSFLAEGITSDSSERLWTVCKSGGMGTEPHSSVFNVGKETISISVVPTGCLEIGEAEEVDLGLRSALEGRVGSCNSDGDDLRTIPFRAEFRSKD